MSHHSPYGKYTPVLEAGDQNSALFHTRRYKITVSDLYRGTSTQSTPVYVGPQYCITFDLNHVIGRFLISFRMIMLEAVYL
jgi:hypothetical protein